jgi:hypothetical protein
MKYLDDGDGEIFADIVQRRYGTLANRKISFIIVRNYEMQKLHRKWTKRNESKGFDRKNIVEYRNFHKIS